MEPVESFIERRSEQLEWCLDWWFSFNEIHVDELLMSDAGGLSTKTFESLQIKLVTDVIFEWVVNDLRDTRIAKKIIE